MKHTVEIDPTGIAFVCLVDAIFTYEGREWNFPLTRAEIAREIAQGMDEVEVPFDSFQGHGHYTKTYFRAACEEDVDEDQIKKYLADHHEGWIESEI